MRRVKLYVAKLKKTNVREKTIRMRRKEIERARPYEETRKAERWSASVG